MPFRPPLTARFLRLQMEEDNREILRLLRDNSTQDKLEGLKRLIALSAPPHSTLALEFSIPSVLWLLTSANRLKPRSERRPRRLELLSDSGEWPFACSSHG